MAYKMELPAESLKQLWMLKEYCAEGPIIAQVRIAVQNYLKEKEEKIGAPIENVAEVIAKHNYENSDRT